MRKLFSLFTLAALVLGVAAPSFAAKPAKGEKPSPEEAFKKMDANSDGSLTVEELVGKREGEKAEAAKKMFAAKDKDKDGKLTLAEFSAKGEKKPK